MSSNATELPPHRLPRADSAGKKLPDHGRAPVSGPIRLGWLGFLLPVVIQLLLLVVMCVMLVVLFEAVTLLSHLAKADPRPQPQEAEAGPKEKPERAETVFALKEIRGKAQEAKATADAAEKRISEVVATLELRLNKLHMRDDLSALNKGLNAHTNRLTDLTTRLEKLEGAGKPPHPVKAKYKRQDILIAVLNTDKLKYDEECRPAIIRLFRNQQTSPDHRLALDIVPTSLQPKVPFGKNVAAMEDADFALGVSTDQRLEHLDEVLARRFAKALDSAAFARVIIVASSACPCPTVKNTWKEAWVNLGVRIDAILIDGTADGTKRPNEENIVAWHAFCDFNQGKKLRGICRVCGKPKEPAALTDALFDCLWELTTPIPGDKK